MNDESQTDKAADKKDNPENEDAQGRELKGRPPLTTVPRDEETNTTVPRDTD